MEKPLSEFLQRFSPMTKAYLVGGFLRDLVRADMSGVATLPKDIDLIIDTYDLEAILKSTPGYLSGTPLGGYRWKPKGTTFWLDIWQLQDTVWIKELRLPVTIESFLDGVDLNIDRIALELHTGEFFDGKCREALAGRTIEIDSRVRVKELMYDEYARALMASYKTGFSLTESLSKRIQSADRAQLRRRAVERLRADDYADEDIREALRGLG
jgi:hypothetical protein